MPGGKSCIVCKYTKAVDPGVHMYRFPANKKKRQQRCHCLALNVEEKDLTATQKVL